jgi:Flp pilus assembly protein TadG
MDGESEMKLTINSFDWAKALELRLHCGALSSICPTFRRSFIARRCALFCAGNEGSALVEFALILPMMLMLTTGLLVFGVAMNNYIQLTNAVSVGARAVAMSSGITLDPCSTASSAIIAAAPGLSSSKMTFSYSLGGNSQSGPSCSSSSLSSGAAAQLVSGSTVVVTVQYPLNLSVFGRKFNANNAVLQASSSELVQ